MGGVGVNVVVFVVDRDAIPEFVGVGGGGGLICQSTSSVTAGVIDVEFGRGAGSLISSWGERKFANGIAGGRFSSVQDCGLSSLSESERFKFIAFLLSGI